MTRSRHPDADDARATLAPDDARFVARLRESFAPEPMDALRRAAFAARLRERMDAASHPARHPGRRLAPALAGFALALAAAWLGLRNPAPEALPEPQPVQVASATRAESLAWEESLFFPAASSEGSERTDLPTEYQAIAVAFLGETL